MAQNEEVLRDWDSPYRTPYTRDPDADAKAAVWETLYDLFMAAQTRRPSGIQRDESGVWLTEKQVASMLSLSVSSLQKMRSRGDGPKFSKKGRAVRYNRDDVREWMEIDRVTSTADHLSRIR